MYKWNQHYGSLQPPATGYYLDGIPCTFKTCNTKYFDIFGIIKKLAQLKQLLYAENLFFISLLLKMSHRASKNVAM